MWRHPIDFAINCFTPPVAIRVPSVTVPAPRRLVGHMVHLCPTPPVAPILVPRVTVPRQAATWWLGALWVYVQVKQPAHCVTMGSVPLALIGARVPPPEGRIAERDGSRANL